MSALDDRREALKRRKKLPELDRRREATQATLDKFKNQAFNWGEGRHCVRLAHYHLRQLGRKPPTLPRIRSALAAKKALTERGWESVSDMLDCILVRIPPAMMLTGDIVTVPGEEGLDAIFICAGPRKFIGWREDIEGCVILDVEMGQISAAWRA